MALSDVFLFLYLSIRVSFPTTNYSYNLMDIALQQQVSYNNKNPQNSNFYTVS